MAKRSNNNSAGRRPYGEKPYDANNSFVKKMANKMGDLIPQRTWISSWFNSSGSNGNLFNDNDHPDDQDIDETMLQPPTKRPRIRMDVTHPPGTFAIQSRGRSDRSREDGEDNDEYHESLEATAGPSSSRSFVASTPAIRTEMRNSSSSMALNPLIPSRPISIQHQKNNGAANGTDGNSESSESISGSSTLFPQQISRQNSLERKTYLNTPYTRKSLIDDKLNSFTNHLQSPRSLFIESITRDSMSSRRPSFNASIMNNNNDSNASVDMDSSSILSSPFYSGNTTFGGANAIERSRKNLAAAPGVSQFQLRVPKRSSVQVKPSNSSTVSDSSGMSQTAKRILEALEHFSSPVTDAKKIPINTPGSYAKKRGRAEAFDYGPTSRVGLRHLTRELAVPTVPDMLKLKRRQRLQDTTLAARKIISANSGPPPSSSFLQNVNSATEIQEYHLRTDNDNQKFFGKLRTKSKKKNDIEQPPEVINLPNIVLPITSLPSFDIPLPKTSNSLPSISTISKTSNVEYSPMKNTKIDSKSLTNVLNRSKETSYKFSSPIRLENDEKRNLKSINDYTFSKPIDAESRDNPSKSPKISLNFVWSASSTAPKPKQRKTENKQIELVEKDVEMKEGSVMDILSNNVEKPEENLWECSECFIKNYANKEICAACKVSKNKTSLKKTPSTISGNISQSSGNENISFGSQFKMTNDKWECKSCLVRNPISQTNCLSCMAPKKEKKNEKTENIASTISSQETSIFGKGKLDSSNLEKFKPSKDSWECAGCMLRNPDKVITCPCCNASKPGLLKASPKETKIEETPKTQNNQGFSGFKLNIPANSWVCSSCSVRNDSTAKTCVCCTTPCPSSSSSTTPISSSAPATSQQSTPVISTGFSGFGDKFKKAAGSWSCDSCMVSNKSDVTECVACGTLKPGATPSTKTSASESTPKFSFGIPAASNTSGFNLPANSASKTTDASKSEASTNGFTFGIPANTSQTNQTFSFGVPGANKTEESSGFTFAFPKTIEGFKSPEKPSAVSSFTFGAPTEVKNHIQENKESKKDDNIPKTLSSGSSPKVPSIQEEPKKPLVSFTIPSSKVENIPANSAIESTTTSTSSITTSGTGGFSFTATKSNATEQTSNVMPFGKSPTPIMAQSSSGTTKINFSASETAKQTDEIQKPAISFGNIANNTINTSSVFGEKQTTEVNKPAISPFGMTSSTAGENKPSGFGNDNKLPSFGSIEPDKVPTFGSASGEKSFFNAPSTSFGSSSATTTVASATPATPASSGFGWSSATPMFGSASGSSTGFGATPTNSAPANPFGGTPASKPAETPTPSSGLFTFGSSSSATSSQTPSGTGFSFIGSTNANTPVATSANQKPAPPPEYPKTAPVAFGFSSGPTPPISSGFGSFGNSTPAVNPSPSTSFFNAAPKPESTPAFGQTAPTSNIFGNSQPSTAGSFSSLTPSSAGGFSFGAPSATNAAPTPSSSSTSGGFNFSAGGTSTASTTGGFNFNAPAAAQPIAFDPNTRPTFNFTGGSAPTAFTAPPQATPSSGTRKFKKAVRRMPPRT